METPPDIEGMLNKILRDDTTVKHESLNALSVSDRDFLFKILHTLTKPDGRGIFVAHDPQTDRMQYMIINASFDQFVALLSRVAMRVAEKNKQP